MKIIIVIKIYFIFLSKLIKSFSSSLSRFAFIFIVCRVVVECAPLQIPILVYCEILRVKIINMRHLC